MPSNMSKREFGFILFRSPQTMIRHKAFSTPKELLSFLENEVPLHAYYSTAYYELPSIKDMDEKGWLGADLVFDIDVDHIPTPCKKDHDTWTCLDCGLLGKGLPPETCPRCKSKRIDKKVWVCDRCLEYAKEEVIRLVEDFLMNDFGFSKNEIKIYFSGHRGFHVHVESKKVLKLNQEARREIVDYIKGIGLKLLMNIRHDLRMSDPGWYGRIAKGLYQLIAEANEELLSNIGLNRREIDYTIANKERILRALEHDLYWNYLSHLSKKSRELLLERVKLQYSVEIDERVTTDIKRLIRLPGSLHGKTGLPVTSVSLEKIEDFNPFDIYLFKSMQFIKVKLISDIPPLRLGERNIEASGKLLTLPFPIGFYLACKGVAKIMW